jgi:hypothetical protein
MFTVEYHLDDEPSCEVDNQPYVPNKGDIIQFCNSSHSTYARCESVDWFVEDRENKLLSVIVRCYTEDFLGRNFKTDEFDI